MTGSFLQRLLCPPLWGNLGSDPHLSTCRGGSLHRQLMVSPHWTESPLGHPPTLWSFLEAKKQCPRTNSPAHAHPLGVILTDTGVSNVVSGDRLHVLASCAQVANTAGEPPRPAVYLHGHGEVCGWSGVPEPSRLTQVQHSRPSRSWREPTSLPAPWLPLPSLLPSSP